MAIRIYALAKELKIDNKKLVDICTKAGIKGKGSALASLTDEELATLKAYMSGGRGGPRRAAAAPAARPRRRRAECLAAGRRQAFRREDYIAPGGPVAGKVPVLSVEGGESRRGRKKPAEEAAGRQARRKRKGRRRR